MSGSGIDITRRGALFGEPWDRQASLDLGQAIVAVIVTRAFEGGSGVDDVRYRSHSTRPIYIGVREFPRPRAARRRRGQAAPDTSSAPRMSRTGRSVFFPGGYRQYKATTLRNTDVNLTRTGRLARSVRVKVATAEGLTVGVSGSPAVYGTGLIADGRKWWGLSPRDRTMLAPVVERVIREAAARTRSRPPGAP